MMARQDQVAPRVSVVIPTRDTRELVERCVNSLAPIAVEILVVDDGSRDGTAPFLLERFPSIQVLTNERPLGFASAVNRGVAATHGELVIVLNSDTEVQLGSLEVLRRVFDENPQLGVAGATLSYPDGSPQWCGGRVPDLLWMFALSSGLAVAVARLPGYRKLRPVSGFATTLREVGWVTGAAMAFRREVWGACGPFDDRFAFYCQDLDFCLRARRAEWRIGIVPGLRVMHHHGATIGRSSGSIERKHPELLWTDLVRWACKYRGARWARRATWALRLGGCLRVAGRTLLGALGTREHREAWRHGTLVYRRALSALAGRARDL